MSKQCGIVRDLMPLCIDGVASEESRRLMEEHMAECKECAGVYAAMHDELAQQQAAEQERKEMEAMLQQLRKRRLRTAGLTALSILLAGLLILLVAWNAEEIAFRVKYVQWNGDLKPEALFAMVSKNAHQTNDDGMRYVHLSSAPSGYPDYELVFESEILEEGKSWCLQVRAKYKGWDTGEYDSGGVFGYGYSEDGVWIGYTGSEYGYLPVSRVELLSGKTATLLWELGDEVPTQPEANAEEQKIADAMKEKQER